MPQSLEERSRRVRLLLQSRFDYLPDPSTATGQLQRSSGHPGPAPSRRVPCVDCLRTGRVVFEYGGERATRACPICDGFGWRRKRAGEEEWDEYLGIPASASKPPSRPFRLDEDIRRLDREVRILEQREAVRDGRMLGDDRYAWETARELRDRLGSYRELGRTLEILGRDYPNAARRLRQKFEGRIPLTEIQEGLVIAAVSWIALEMRGEIRIPPWLETPARAEKETNVKDLAALGWTAGKIARHLRIPKEKVRRLLKTT